MSLHLSHSYIRKTHYWLSKVNERKKASDGKEQSVLEHLPQKMTGTIDDLADP